MLIDSRRCAVFAQTDYADIVVDVIAPGMNVMRIFFRDGSWLNVWYSLKLAGRYSFHFDRRSVDGSIYRYDNTPHARWSVLSTFPAHFHNGCEDRVENGALPADPVEALRTVLDLARGLVK